MLLLAPMEGVIDPSMRWLLTRIGGYARAVTEFVRLTDQRLPNRLYYRLCPELLQGGQVNGTPVFVQLLGADPQLMAESAAQVAELGAPGIDLNFGCPSKAVNRNNGGAVLLQYPDRLQRIIAAVRRAVPAEVPITAKLRLGYQDTELALDNARAAAEGGAHSITVHARTQREGYRPPAHWHWLARIRAHVAIEVVANGEIWTPEDARHCREISGCRALMLGRGALARPDLARQIEAHAAGRAAEPMAWSAIVEWVEELSRTMEAAGHGKAIAPRLKQWLAALQRAYPQAAPLFERTRTERDYRRINAILKDAREASIRQSLPHAVPA